MNNKIDIDKLEKIKESKQFNERRDFIIENYPLDESSYDVDDLIAGGLDGKKVLEKRGKIDQVEEILGLLTYDIYKDNNGINYASIGIMLKNKESQEEGVMKELFIELKRICEKEKCEYIDAIADTEYGEDFLQDRGFDFETDSREYLRLYLVADK